MSLLKLKSMAVNCILLKDGIATKKSKTLAPKTKTQQQFQSLQGSLWVLDGSTYDGQKFSDPKADLSRVTVKLNSLDDDSVTHVCQGSDVAKITVEQRLFLQAVSTCADRYKVFQDSPWMLEANKIKVNSVVYVINTDGLADKSVALVKYKGTVNHMQGIWFGLELSEESRGKGTTDGTFRKERYFHCDMDNGLFVPISKIRRCPNHLLFKTSTKNHHIPVEHQEPIEMSPDEPPPELCIGEQVIWVDDHGTPCMATVHWIGHLPNSPDSEWTVGVEFESKIGTGTGKYKDTQLFKARNGHASLIPILGLMKAEEYYGGKDNIPATMATERSDTNKIGGSKGDIFGETSHTLAHKNISQVGNQQPKKTVLDENYYRESYKTNRGEYDILRNGGAGGNRIAGDDPIYACVRDVRNDTTTDRTDTQSNKKGSQSEVIYTLPNRGQKCNERQNNTDTIIHKRTIIVNHSPTSKTTTADVHDGLYDQSKSRGISSSTQNITYNGSKTHPTAVQSQSTDNVFKANHFSESSPPAVKRKNSPVMHEDVVRDRFLVSYPPDLTNGSNHNNTTSHQSRNNSPTEPKFNVKSLTVDEINEISEFGLGSVVEVDGTMEQCKYGVIKWMGYLQEKKKPIVGLEMEEESSACTDGTFGGQRLFDCAQRKAFFVYLSKLKKDGRFEESDRYMHRTMSQAFGSLECPDVDEDLPPRDHLTDVRTIIGRNKGIQGHHNSCYLDATLFSMFAFTQTFDSLLFRVKTEDDIQQYNDVQLVLKDGIVNPLRKNFFVRADKVLKLRTLLDKLSSVQGLMTEEKDPEEFFTSLLQQILKAQPLLKLSNGQTSYLYQLFVEKDEKIMLPTTEQLLELSFLQADMKLSEAPNCLILQMPRFGKDYKMYKKIVPSLYLDITDILEHGPRECHLCGQLATHECRDCFQQTTVFESGLSKTAFCVSCLKKYHQHRNRQSHQHKLIQPNKEYQQFLEQHVQRGLSLTDTPMPREVMELFAVICIETSHYVAFVKCGKGKHAPWVLFDSMADRMGEQNGYNIPEVKRCDFLPDLLLDHNKLMYEMADKTDKEMGDLKRLLCDGYICMYRSRDLDMYN